MSSTYPSPFVRIVRNRLRSFVELKWNKHNYLQTCSSAGNRMDSSLNFIFPVTELSGDGIRLAPFDVSNSILWHDIWLILS